MNKKEIIKRCKENRRNINFINTNCAPEIWIKNNLKVNKEILGEIILKLEDPRDRTIIDNPKPAWMPRMICSIVDLPFNVGRDYTWAELEQLVIDLSLAGCDGIRIFGTGWEPYIEPFIKTDSGEYSFFKPNTLWDATLVEFRELLHKYHMCLYVDEYDNCSHRAEWNPFANNIHEFSHYFYGYTEQIATNRFDIDCKAIKVNEIDFMMEYWDNRILNCLIPGKDIVGLGNELKSHVENDVSERKVWAEKWGVARAKNMLDHGFNQPIPFSGSEGEGKTAHKLHGFISKEEHPEYGWTYRTSCNQIHGKGTPGHVAAWAEDGISQRRVFAYDDDGVGTNPDSKVPPSQRGYCEIRKNGSEYACTADTATRIETVRSFINELGKRTYCFSIGFLPRSILYKGKTVLSRFDIEVDAAIYWRLALDLWDVDIKRKWSTA